MRVMACHSVFGVWVCACVPHQTHHTVLHVASCVSLDGCCVFVVAWGACLCGQGACPWMRSVGSCSRWGWRRPRRHDASSPKPHCTCRVAPQPWECVTQAAMHPHHCLSPAYKPCVMLPHDGCVLCRRSTYTPPYVVITAKVTPFTPSSTVPPSTPPPPHTHTVTLLWQRVGTDQDSGK